MIRQVKQAAPPHAGLSQQCQEVKSNTPEYMEQAPGMGHEASPQSGLGGFLCEAPGFGLGLRCEVRRAEEPL